MAPFLESDTSLSEARYKKYVFVENKIYYADPEDGDSILHAELVRKLAEKLGKSIRDIERDFNGKPIVDAAGKIEEWGGKFGFGITNTTCALKYGRNESRQKVAAAAVMILGEDKVYT